MKRACRSRFRCPTCSSMTGVIDSRPIGHGKNKPDAWRRRRQCLNGHRFTTYEVPATSIADAKAKADFVIPYI
jgi:transcriptional regulator NrdR family protein